MNQVWKFLSRPDGPQPWPAVIPNAPAEQGEPYVYRVPFPPPSGRRVRSHKTGQVWVIDPTGDVARDDDRSIVLTWGQLIGDHGPLELLELTPEETASEAVYGPIGARWGDPDTPCAYEGCALGTGHAQTHRDAAGNVLGMTEKATEKYVDPPPGQMLSRICTCGVVKHTAKQHEPGCARYVTPRQDDTVPAALPMSADEWLADKGMAPGMILAQPDPETGAPGPIEVHEQPAVAKPRTRRARSAGTTSPAPATGRKRNPRTGGAK